MSGDQKSSNLRMSILSPLYGSGKLSGYVLSTITLLDWLIKSAFIYILLEDLKTFYLSLAVTSS